MMNRCLSIHKPRLNIKTIVAKYFLFLLIGIVSYTYAGQYEIKGRVVDGLTGQLLSFANVRVDNSTRGTAANVNGAFELKLPGGNYTLIASYLGYTSDTLDVNLTADVTVNFALDPAAIEYDEITVFPGVNPAPALIKKAIARKRERNKLLNSYVFNAYTKGIIKTTGDISAGSGSVGIGVGSGNDSLKITGILENESKGYFKKPDLYKEEIVARKQSANIPPTVNILTGGRIIQDFYSDDIRFFNRELTGPLADNAPDFYNYLIEDTLAIDDKNVFQLYFVPFDVDAPGFYGRLFITDKTYDLIRIDAYLTPGANPGRIFSRVNVFQQFVPYANGIYMPIDYRLFAEGSFLGLVEFGFEINSILYDYRINPDLPDDFFNMVVLKVYPDADNKDPDYWSETQSIPPTLSEIKAYQRIDSLESEPRSFWDKFSPLSTEFSLTDHLTLTAPLGLYHFNRVEGHSIDFDVKLYDIFDRRLNNELNLSYGFADERFKGAFYTEYLSGDYRTNSFTLELYDKTAVLFSDADYYNRLTSTLTNLIGKYDFRDYYRTRGFNFEANSQVFPVLGLTAGFTNRTDNSLDVVTDYSLFNKEKVYRVNKQVNDTRMNIVNIGFKFDYRKYIEDGYFRRRITQGSYFTISGKMFFTNKNIFNSQTAFEIYRLSLFGSIDMPGSTNLELFTENYFTDDPVPVQLMKALPGNINVGGKNNSFRTLRYGEVFGNKVNTLFVSYDIGDELWRLLNIPILKDSQVSLAAHLNAAYVNLEYLQNITASNIFLHPFYEAGFSLGHPLLPLRFEFTWKLNHRGNNNFVFGLNTFVL